MLAHVAISRPGAPFRSSSSERPRRRWADRGWPRAPARETSIVCDAALRISGFVVNPVMGVAGELQHAVSSGAVCEDLCPEVAKVLHGALY